MATAHYIGRAQRAGVHIGYGVKVTQLLKQVDTSAVSSHHCRTGRVSCGLFVAVTDLVDGLGGGPNHAGDHVRTLYRAGHAKVPQLLRAFGFVLQRPSGRTVVERGSQCQHGVFRRLPRAAVLASASLAFRKRIGLHLDTRRIAEQLRNRSTLGTSWRRIPRRNPPSTVRSTRHSHDCPHSSLTTTGPALPVIGRAWSTSRQTACRSSTAGPDPKVSTIVAGLCGHRLALGPCSAR